MIPPRGFKSEVYPLRHKLKYSFGLNIGAATQNSAYATLIRHTSDNPTGGASVIEVNPHNSNYKSETGAAVQKMSIIDRMRLSINFNMTSGAATDGLEHIKLLWRPIAFSFPEKLDAADDVTSTTVQTILQLTKDATFEDIVPVTATKLPVAGGSELSQPMSTENVAVEDFTDYNMTTDASMEATAWDEDLFQDAVIRYTNKGALKACVGRTRHINLTKQRPIARFFFNKFVPRSVRRIQEYSFMAILVHLPLTGDITQSYLSANTTGAIAHIGCKILARYHEWNSDHFQEMAGTGV